jgi:hypothetical protein
LIEIPEQLTTDGGPSSTATRATSEQVVPSVDPMEPTSMETAIEQRTSEQVPPEASDMEHTAMEEKVSP